MNTWKLIKYLYPHYFGGEQLMPPEEVDLYKLLMDSVEARKKYPDLSDLQHEDRLDLRHMPEEGLVNSNRTQKFKQAGLLKPEDENTMLRYARKKNFLNSRERAESLAEYLNDKDVILETEGGGRPIKEVPSEGLVEHFEEFSKSFPREKMLESLKKNYKSGMLDPKRNAPMRWYGQSPTLENFVPPEGTSSADIYKAIEKAVYPIIDHASLKDNIRKLEVIKGHELSLMPNRDEVFEELRRYRPDIADRLKQHLIKQNRAALEEYTRYKPKAEREKAYKEFAGGREWILPQDLEALNLTADDFDNLPHTKKTFRKMGYSKNMMKPHEVFEEKFKNHPQFVEAVENTIPHKVRNMGNALSGIAERYAPNLTNSMKDAWGQVTSAVSNRVQANLEKFYGTPDVATNFITQSTIDARYKEFATIVEITAKDSPREAEIMEALRVVPTTAIDAFLNNPELFLQNPNEALSNFVDFAEFERPAFREIWNDISPQMADELGDAFVDIAKDLNIQDWDEVNEFIREHPQVLKSKLDEIYPRNEFTNWRDADIGYYLKDREFPQNFNKNGWRHVNLNHNAQNPHMDDFVPRAEIPQNIRVGELNSYMRNNGLWGAANVFNEIDGGVPNYDVDDLRSALSEQPEWLSEISETPSEYQTAVNEQPSDYQSIMSEEPNDLRSRALHEIRRTPNSFVNPRFNAYLGKALKGFGKASDLLMLLDAADIGAKDAVTYKDAMANEGFIKGGFTGLANTFGRGYNYLAGTYNSLRDAPVTGSLNKKWMPELPYYSSEYVHPEIEQQEQGFFEGIGNKVQNIGDNLNYTLTGAQPQTQTQDYDDLDFEGAHNPVGHPMFSDEMASSLSESMEAPKAIKPVTAIADSGSDGSSPAASPSPDLVRDTPSAQIYLGKL